MRKVVTLRLWVDDDWNKGKPDNYYMSDDCILSDIDQELSCCWHNFDIISFETMEINNEKQTLSFCTD